MGSEFEGKRVQGLVDCENEAEFEQNYITKESQWPENFRQWMVTSKGIHRSMKDTLQHCMLKTVRIAAGLGNPPNKHLCPEMHAMTKMADLAIFCQFRQISSSTGIDTAWVNIVDFGHLFKSVSAHFSD